MVSKQPPRQSPLGHSPLLCCRTRVVWGLDPASLGGVQTPNDPRTEAKKGAMTWGLCLGGCLDTVVDQCFFSRLIVLLIIFTLNSIYCYHAYYYLVAI